MAKTDREGRVGKRLLASLERGDLEAVHPLISGAEAEAVAHAFADLLDGTARPLPIVGRFVSACWAEGRVGAGDRRRRGKRTPAAVSDVPTEPSARRRYLVESLDAVPQDDLVQLFGAAAAGASAEARQHAAQRLTATAPSLEGHEVSGPEKDTVDRSIRALGVVTPLDRLRAARNLLKALESDIHRSAIDARAEGRTWRDVGEALGVTPDAARKRFGQRTGVFNRSGTNPPHADR